MPLSLQGTEVVEVSPDELIVVGSAHLLRLPLEGCGFELRDARSRNRFVRHLWIASATELEDIVVEARLGGPRVASVIVSRMDLVTDSRLGAIAPRAARLPEVEPTAIVGGDRLVGLLAWLQGGRRLLGQSLDDLALLSCLASVSFAIEIGERAADLATQMTWERGSPMRSSPVTDARTLLEPFEKQAFESERANLALMAGLALLDRGLMDRGSM